MELLERETQLRELEAALHDAVNGAGRLALVSGEAGIGKTALVERFAREQRADVRVLWGACDALFTPRPLGPLHDMAMQLRGALPALLNEPEKRTAVFSAVLAELQSRPITVAVFEDIHWADEATLDLLKYLARRIARTSALLVLTYRDDEVGPTHPLRALLGDLAAAGTVRRITLTPLSLGAVRAVVGGRPLDAETLHQQTGGNPFFVTEVVANQTSRMPATIRDAVLARAARLSPSARAVLEAAAVIGPRIEAWALAAVTGAEAQFADECIGLGVLIPAGEVLAFRHELARQAVLDSISPTHRLALHRMTLEALRANPLTQNDLTRLAHHAEGAGDREAILEFAPKAASAAALSRARRAAAALYKLALRFADDLPTAERAELWEAYATQREGLEPRKEAIAARRTAAELWREAGDPQRYGNNLASAAMGLSELGAKDECDQTIEAALAVLESLPPSPMLMVTYRTKALQHLFRAEDSQAIALAENGLAVAQRLEEPSVVASAYEGLGLCWLGTDVGRACEFLERSLALQREAGMELRLGAVCANLGSVYCEHFQFADADRVLAEGLAVSIEYDLDRLQAFIEGWRALMYLHRGRWAEATELATQSLQRATGGQIPALMALGLVRTRRGDPTAAEALNQALETGLKLGNLQRMGLVRAACAESAWLAGNRSLTLEHARALFDVAVAKRHPWVAGELAFWRWRAGDDVPPLPEWTARPYALHLAGDCRGAAAEWERLGCPYEQARALADGDPEAQTAALAIFERLNARPAADELRARMQAAGTRIPRGPNAATRENPFGLTARQSQILALLAEGLTNLEIAARLHLSPKTVDHHVSAVLARLEVESREAAAAIARGQKPLSP
jgi:DNA-binding CsgD family transcriptional regulator